MSNVERIRDGFVQLWGSLGSFWGVPPTTARVFGWLFARAEAVDAERLMDALGLSRGAVSMACRELREWGLVHQERVSGSRRVAYRAEGDLEQVTRSIIELRKRREWDPIAKNLREWLPALQAENTDQAAVLRQRLQAMAALVGLADSAVEGFLRGGTMAATMQALLVPDPPAAPVHDEHELTHGSR